tara:strand:+ start:885 stop:1241 length:357 start_codon:yes stop_codon:yes gene_type:complete
MAHFAELDETNTVIGMVVVHNDITTIDGVEDEQRGIDFLDDLFPDSATWVQTSYNATIRYNYAGIGHTWDGTGFATPQPYGSWALDVDYVWQPPTPYPDDGNDYDWDEASTSWVEITE